MFRKVINRIVELGCFLFYYVEVFRVVWSGVSFVINFGY